ncbi:type II toxin-antitoxin system Phd/YefM family antitoxin [Dickeya ananatis]|uniref:antitoxin of toxin-antitoxin stability system n=1 Tax=Dickeya ananatis TaxID=3061286 RepID=UPI00388F9F30
MGRILAEKSIDIIELRKNPAKYCIDGPVAVLSNNRPAGYMIRARVHTAARFRPTAERLNGIAQSGQTLLQNASDKDLSEFSE